MTQPALAVAIQAHPKREANIPAIVERLTPHVEPVVIFDHESRGPWVTARRCWEALLEQGAQHSLILQDDVVLCRDFVPGAIRALAVRPASCAVSFYANHKGIDAARGQGWAWAKIPADKGIWGQSMCIPTLVIADFLQWVGALPIVPKETINGPSSLDGLSDDYKWDDWILGQYLRVRGYAVWATVPSLVEHGAPNASLIGFSNKNKVARWFIGVERSALSINWVLAPDLV